MRRLRPLLLAAGLAIALLVGCGGGDSDSSAKVVTDSPASGAPGAAPARRAGDWTRFGYDIARTDDAPPGISAAKVARLSEQRVKLAGTVDSSPIYLSRVRVKGRERELLVMTTTYGKTLGVDAATGATLWTFTPSSYSHMAGSPQITTATPVADPSDRYVYAASPDGLIHKLRVSNGSQARSGHWPVSVTRDPSHEKIASALNLDGRWVLVTTGGYIGDAPPYQGKVVAIDRRSGRIAHVFNSLCSNRRAIINPSTCSAQESAIWGRAGAVGDPVTHKVYTTSSNGPWNGSTNWGDTLLELSPGVGRFLRHWTPADQKQLEEGDVDLGSTSPVLLPDPNGGRTARFLLQGGKDARLHLLDLRTSLFGVTGAAGTHLGGEVQDIPVVGNTQMSRRPPPQGADGGVRGHRRRHRRLSARRRTARNGVEERHLRHQSGAGRGALVGLRPGRRAQRLPALQREADPQPARSLRPLEQPDRRRRPRLPAERQFQRPRHLRRAQHLSLAGTAADRVALGHQAARRCRIRSALVNNSSRWRRAIRAGAAASRKLKAR
jgi:hypothetical protein